MLTLFAKKKITDTQLAQAFVRRFLDAVDEAWPEIAEFINESPEFVQRPNIDPTYAGPFAMIILTGNLNNLQAAMTPARGNLIRGHILEMLADTFGMEYQPFCKRAHEFRAALARVNHPSKNTISAMSKSLFWRYNLNEYQRDDYREVGLPNPQFIQRLDEIMQHFLWDWEEILKNYKVTW